jgi:hypothetical protein
LLRKFKGRQMLFTGKTQHEIVEMVRQNPQLKSWEIMKELRRRGSPVPPRFVVQCIRSTTRFAVGIPQSRRPGLVPRAP